MRRSRLSTLLLVCAFAGCTGNFGLTKYYLEDDSGAADEDGDGYPASEDCDDTDPDISPDAEELCDGVDNDCDEETDEGVMVTWYNDRDTDGYGSGDPQETCIAPTDAALEGGDCDDQNVRIHPGADELCDGVDNDCDGTTDIDAVDAVPVYADADGDGFGDPANFDLGCSGITNDWDCNDADATEPQVADPTAVAAESDGTLAHPWTSLQTALDAADECVVAQPGTYLEAIDFHGRSVLVRSAEGPDVTVIDANGAGPAVTFATSETFGAELSGFTLTGGAGHVETTSTSVSCGSTITCTTYYTTWCGGGVYIDGGEPALSDLVIATNDLSAPDDTTSGYDTYLYYSFGGGMCVRNAVIEAVGVTVRGNTAEDGGGVYVESGARLTLVESAIEANVADDGGGIEVDGGTAVLTNVLVAWNTAGGTGGGVYAADASVALTNVTVGGNDALSSGGGLYVDGTSTAVVQNSIVYASGAGAGVVAGASATLNVSYTDVYGNTGGEYSGVADPTGSRGNLSLDPLFVGVTDDGDPTDDDWHLGSGSPAIDAGNGATEFDDVDGTRNDMGVFGGPSGG